jgi:GT2 family glycosyltransferase
MTEGLAVNTHPHVSIILLNWNQPEFTLACLESLDHVEYPSFDVIVVDNGSVDNSVPLIRQRFPGVTLLENPENLGFAGGNNVGIQHALERGADYLLLLNNDTEVAPNMLRALVDVGEAEPGVGALGPKIYYYDHSNVIWSAGGAIDRFGEPSHLLENTVDEGLPDRVQDVDYVTGCAFMVKRRVVEAVGALDPRFFIYFEETEWCARIRRAGFRITYVPQARMWHKISMEARTTSRRYLYLMTRNRLLYLRLSNAGLVTIAGAAADLLRTALSWSLKPQHRAMRQYSTALVRGIADFAVGRFGAPPARP